MTTRSIADAPDVMSVEDCAAFLGVSRDTIWRMAKRGEIPAAKIGRRWFIPKGQLMERIEGLVNA